MTTKNKALIFNFLNAKYPEVKGELLYNSDYELLIAVVLSAQATDKQVNIVTRKLFNDYPTFTSLLAVSEEEFAHYFKTLGLFRNKANHVFNLVKILNEKYDGRVPVAKEALISLPGVGIKTANVVRAELFKIPEIAVDTHVARIAKRLGFAAFSDDVTKVETKLRKAIKKESYIKTHHQFIHFGRYFCTARSPKCRECPLISICREPDKNL